MSQPRDLNIPQLAEQIRAFLDKLVPEDPERPVLNEILQAIVAKAAKVEQTLARLAKCDADTVRPVLKDLGSHIKAVEELMSWILTTGERGQEEIAFRAVLAIYDIRRSQDDAWDWFENHKPRRGRPRGDRRYVVRALEFRKSGKSLKKVTDLVCPCSKPSHDQSCQNEIRSQIANLNRVLSKYSLRTD